jgi:hypothetical protein
MYHFPVDSMVNSYYEKFFVHSSDFQKILGLDQFESYQEVISIQKPPRFSNVKNKWQSYSENDENCFSSEYTQSEIKDLIQRFEKKFDMSSNRFKELYAIGEIPDAFEVVLWKSFLGLK